MVLGRNVIMWGKAKYRPLAIANMTIYYQTPLNISPKESSGTIVLSIKQFKPGVE